MPEEMVSFNPWVIAYIVFTLLVLIIGLVTTIGTVAKAKGPRERRYLIRSCASFWLALAVLVLLIGVLPSPWRFWVLVPFFILVPAGIYRASGRAMLIREIDKRDQEAPARED